MGTGPSRLLPQPALRAGGNRTEFFDSTAANGNPGLGGTDLGFWPVTADPASPIPRGRCHAEVVSAEHLYLVQAADRAIGNGISISPVKSVSRRFRGVDADRDLAQGVRCRVGSLHFLPCASVRCASSARVV
jgi:hypothetical protein